MERPASLTQRSIYAELRGQVTAPASGNTPAQPRPRHNRGIGIIVEGNPQVTGEPQVVAGPFQHPGGQGVAFLVEFGAAGRVECDAGLGGVGEVCAVRDAVLTGDRGLAFLAGGTY